MIQEELAFLILKFGNVINNFLSIPSSWIPYYSSNLVLIIISVFFGWFYGKKAFAGFKTLSMTILSILFYGFMRWINIG